MLRQELIRRMRAHAPVEVDDFATWSGLPVILARKAWKTLAQTGSITDYDSLSVSAELREELPGSPARLMCGCCLPTTTTSSVAGPGSCRFRRSPWPGRVWPGGGVILPTVVADGLTFGTWARRDAGRVVKVDAFAPLSSQVQTLVDAETSAVTRFLQPAV